jgi:hypothetical protein
MAENIPNLPGGSLPPKPSDSKVLPKKETVRITLPPKPTAAPTIKLPTLPPGGPAAMSAPQAPASRPGSPATSAPRAAGPASSAAAAQRPAQQQRPVQQQRPAPARTVSGFDKVLAIVAGVAALAAAGTTAYVLFMVLNPYLEGVVQ